MPTRILADCKLTAATAVNRYQEAFVSLMKFLTSSYVSGTNGFIERVAYQTNSGSTDFNYWDDASPCGNNSWACFRFVSASTPFYMLVQEATTNFGAVPGNPGNVDGSSGGGTAGIGVAFALRGDGGNPWGGTMRNDGTDTKGSPVWVSGSSTLMVWPRGNSFGGTYASNREMTTGPIYYRSSDGPALNARFHCIVNEENVVFVADDSADNNNLVTAFGRYTPASGTLSPTPYVMIRYGADYQDLQEVTCGSATAFAQTANEGGIAHPNLPMSGTKSVYVTQLNGFNSTAYQPNKQLPVRAYMEFPLFLNVNESGPHYGFAGVYDTVRTCYGVNSLDTNQDLTRAYFGSSTAGTLKMSVPWNPVTTPGGGQATRTGSMG